MGKTIGSRRQFLLGAGAGTVPLASGRDARAQGKPQDGWLAQSSCRKGFRSSFPLSHWVAGRFAKIGIPAPAFFGPFVGVTEIVCGPLPLTGLVTRLVAIFLIVDISIVMVTTKLPMLGLCPLWSVAAGHSGSGRHQTGDCSHRPPSALGSGPQRSEVGLARRPGRSGRGGERFGCQRASCLVRWRWGHDGGALGYEPTPANDCILTPPLRRAQLGACERGGGD